MHASTDGFFSCVCPNEKMGANAWYSLHGFELIHAECDGKENTQKKTFSPTKYWSVGTVIG